MEYRQVEEPMARRTNVPAVFETEIINTIGHWYDDIIGRAMTAEASRAHIRQDICDRLQAGTLDVAWVIDAANAGHQDADLAVRAYAATFADQGRWEQLPRQVQGYMVGAMLRAPTTYPRGKNFLDTYTRDVGIAVMVDVAATRWALQPTRGRSTEEPSAAYFVSHVLRKRGHRLKEQQVNRIHHERNKLAARLAASMRAANPGAF
jgi:hypothetical protein